MDVSALVVMQIICLSISVIFLRNNYNFDIPAVANVLPKDIEKLDRRNSYANHVINN